MLRMRECFDLQADHGSGTAAAHRTATFIAVTVTSVMERNAMNIHVNAMKIQSVTPSPCITPLNVIRLPENSILLLP